MRALILCVLLLNGGLIGELHACYRYQKNPLIKRGEGFIQLIIQASDSTILNYHWNASDTIVQSFKAMRTKTLVELLWETKNIRIGMGYEIQRRTTASGWERVAFVYPQTNTSIDNAVLIYEYTDVNISHNETLYRLRYMYADKESGYSAVIVIPGRIK